MILEAINNEINDCKNSVKAGQEGTVLVSLPRRQSGPHALRQGAGGGGFIQLVLRSSQRSQHAHCNSTNITMKRQPAKQPCSDSKKRRGTTREDQRARTSLGGGVAVCVLDDQVIQVRVLVLCHHELAPVIHRQSQQTLDNLNRKGLAKTQAIRVISVCCLILFQQCRAGSVDALGETEGITKNTKSMVYR